MFNNNICILQHPILIRLYKNIQEKIFYNAIKNGLLSSILTNRDRYVVQRVDNNDRKYFAFFDS